MKRGLVLAAIAAWSCIAAAADAPAPVRVLILSGANNHDWAATTPVVERLFAGNARFAVIARIDDPAKCDADLFARCDAVVSNWSAFPAMTGRQWGPAAEKAFVEFVRGGKGFVVFHAASATSQDWPEFQQLVGLTWGLDKTAHSAYHPFKVTVETREHPITAGMPDFWTVDELWHNMVAIAPPQFTTLARAFSHGDFGGTGKPEPVVITTRLGAGRGVNIVLGHDVGALRNPAWQTLMLRATEWAATGQATIPIPEDWPATAAAAMVAGIEADAAIAATATYRLGASREALGVVELLVAHACTRGDAAGSSQRAALAGKIGAMLATDVHVDVKNFLCRQLAAIGTAAQVPVLVSSLADERVADRACEALERIPGQAASAALLAALAAAKGERRVAFVNALGNRGERGAVSAIAACLQASEPQLLDAAASALARIGGEEALVALAKAWVAAADEAPRTTLAVACIACADRLAAAGKSSAAAAIYLRAYSPPHPVHVRMAALRGLVACSPDDADRLLVAAIAQDDPHLGAAAVQLVRERAPRNDQAGDAVVAWLGARLKESTRRAETRALLGQLGRQRTLEALQLAHGYLADPDLREDASLAVIEAAAALVERHRAEVKAALRDVLAGAKLPEIVKPAKALLGRAARSQNLARTATASSPDGLEPDGGSGPDAAAIDGNPDTYWDETDGQKLYRFKLTFPAPIDVSAIVVKGHACKSHSPRDFEILCDDKVVAAAKDAAYDPATNELFVAFPRTRATTLELVITGYFGGSPGIRELEVYDIDAR